jgi:hypothetical protein
MTKSKYIGLFFVLIFAASVSAQGRVNVLTEKEKRDGWRLLFDGQSTKGWITTTGEPLPQRHVQNGCLNPHPCDYMLVYGSLLENFVLSLDFKITTKCNSGIFVRTFPLASRSGKDIGYNGIEVAIDDTKTAGFYDTGAFYDLVKPTKNAMRPVGDWNHVLITSNNNLLEVTLNAESVSRINLDEWTKPNKRPDGSNHKFGVSYKNHPRKGYIGLQDHGSDCWFRNIKLKPLP